MLGWFQALLPKEEKFYDLFERHAETLVAGAAALDRVLSGEGDLKDGIATLFAEEEKADRIAKEVMLAVRRTFITPFDRGDIKSLIASMDDAIDQMRKTAKTITLFEVERFDPEMRELGGTVVAAARKVEILVPLLRDMAKNSMRINAIVEEIGEIEEHSDEVHVRGLKSLFQAHRTGDAMGYIVGSEIYDHLEKVVDKFEDVAKTISGIVIEHL
jgi:uncharacterized protein